MPIKFRNLKIGERFNFAGEGPRSFRHTCTKTSARCYEWTEATGTYKAQVGSINVLVEVVTAK